MKKILALAVGAVLAASAGKSQALLVAHSELNEANCNAAGSSANAHQTLVVVDGSGLVPIAAA